MNSSGFARILAYFRKLSENTAQQGNYFELLMKRFFKTSPLYTEIFEEVWLWNEFPYNGGVHDFGIDLVAKKKDFDEYCAIQCKFYDETNPVSKEDVDSFIGASGKPFFINGKPYRYSERIIVSTTDKWTLTAEMEIVGQTPPITRIRLNDLQHSGIDWDDFSLQNINSMKRDKRKKEYTHQVEAINAVLDGFSKSNRGKLIMACGTGKTFTALKIGERLTKGNGSILFLVPSISLLNQTLLEWSAQCQYEYSVFAICSDPKASRDSDSLERVSDTIIPATTNVERLIEYYTNNWADDELKLFFSTYQSIDVISKFQKQTGLVFDLIICDEAHRTTGVTLAGEDESDFVKIHNDDFVSGKKRLYMTATPRIYGDESKTKATEKSALLCSMDDEDIYGKEFYRLGFSEAVSLGLLSDYKVIVLAVDEKYVSKTLQNLLTDSSSELTLEDSVKIIGCLNGLSKRTLFEGEEDYFANDPVPMKRAVAFCNNIAASKKFVQLTREIQDELKLYGYDESLVSVEVDHVDGTNNALFRKSRIDWLKESIPEGRCRVLSNARCLSEGIDVPALDAVIFLNPRNSIVDIIQSVGRVMRKAESKKFGYIILPVGIPAGMEPEEALADNQRYKIVWDVLQALRAHDDRFNNTINKIDLNRKKPENIQVIGVTGWGNDENEGKEKGHNQSYSQLSLNLEDLQKWKNSIYAQIVKKCGSRRYWETWAKDIADIARRHIEEIKLLIKKPEIEPKFEDFLKGLRKNLNSSIGRQDAIEMLAEHMITKPVFDALFEDYEFIKSNPVSIIMQDMLDVLGEKALGKEQETLDKFYLSVQERAKGIDNAEGKQKIVIELYEQFFKNALPKQVAKLGIVYTPIEVVDFILNSVNDVLIERFGCNINTKGVHILDPFTGTGTFIVQLLRSGLISIDNMLYKYTNELHANEIVLLAYYIATINIEETFHDLMQANDYIAFEGIVLTDTFALSETVHSKGTDGTNSASMNSSMFQQNSERAIKQLESPITVIIGNPPYSVGQKSGNDNNQNVSYEYLDRRLAETYVAKSKATLTRNAYDTYIKAFRWASDRLEENGVIGFVSNGAYLDSVALDGFRQCLIEEFNSIYCFNLRGNQRTSGELSRKEGGKIFGSGSRTPVAITILVKKKGIKKDGFIRYYDIGDYLTREQKLNIIREFNSIKNIQWKYLVPNANNDWINQRNPDFMNFIALGDKKKREKESIFLDNYASGLSSNRDVWVYNFSKEVALYNANRMIDFYNTERIRCNQQFEEIVNDGVSLANSKARETYLQNIRSNDDNKISWSRGLFKKFCKNEEVKCSNVTRIVAYRPFCKKCLAYNIPVIEMPSRWDSIFPEETSDNLVICVSGAPIKKRFSVLITDCIQDLNFMEHSLSMPLYFYDKVENKNDGQMNLRDFMQELMEKDTTTYRKRYAISDVALAKFRDMYGSKIKKEDVFFYVYAVLQSEKYIELYADNLSKEMPRIPLLDKFGEYVKIGKELADLHIHYEKPINPDNVNVTINITKEDYTVEKMKFHKEGKTVDKTTIQFNPYITISNIPDKAYDYVINGKSAIEWVMERYAITVDKASGIVDDPNNYSDKKYIFNLLVSVIYVSIKTQELISELPEYKEI